MERLELPARVVADDAIANDAALGRVALRVDTVAKLVVDGIVFNETVVAHHRRAVPSRSISGDQAIEEIVMDVIAIRNHS